MLPFHKLTLVSVNPGTVGRRQIAAKSPDALPTAAGGILPGKASADDGAIRPDDLLVSSSKLGYAMNGTDRGLTLRATSDRATS